MLASRAVGVLGDQGGTGGYREDARGRTRCAQVRVNVVSPGPIATPIYGKMGMPETQVATSPPTSRARCRSSALARQRKWAIWGLPGQRRVALHHGRRHPDRRRLPAWQDGGVTQHVAAGAGCGLAAERKYQRDVRAPQLIGQRAATRTLPIHIPAEMGISAENGALQRAVTSMTRARQTRKEENHANRPSLNSLARLARRISYAMLPMVIAGASLAAATVAQAQQATSRRVPTCAGPDRGYPAVAWLGSGTSVYVHGCVRGYYWCDVSAGGVRGWANARHLQYLLTKAVASRSMAPVLATAFRSWVLRWAPYWDSYRDRPWYGDRHRWDGWRPGAAAPGYVAPAPRPALPWHRLHAYNNPPPVHVAPPPSTLQLAPVCSASTPS